MAKAKDGNLTRLAERIADGRSVDWDREESNHGQDDPRLRHLRLVESVARAHRISQEKGSPDPIHLSLAKTTLDVGEQRSAPRDPPTTSWGGLHLLGKIAEGGFGEVYRAYDPTLDREVALKLRRNESGGSDPFRGRFLHEARLLARIRHPNALIVYGADEHDGRPGLWTDLLEGKTLEECLASHGPFSAHEAAMIGIDLCQALSAVHGAGLVHRDVKTANVMRENGGRIVLLDFGCVTEQVNESNATSSGLISGTPVAMAPEVLYGEPPAPTADIYSLGVLLFRLVSNRYPVEARTLSELREKASSGGHTPLRDVRSDLPPAFVQVVEQALSVEPDERFSSAGTMEAALRAAVGVRRRTTQEQEERHGRIRRWAAFSAATAVVFTLIAVAVIQWVLPGPRFKVKAAFFREGRQAHERLLPGAQVRPGDKLFLEIESSEPLHLYVLNEDEAGDSFVLFPLPGLHLQNPLPGAIRHRIPGKMGGEPIDWNVTSAGGKENFLVIASIEPLEALEEEMMRLGRAERGRPVVRGAPVRLDARAVTRLRGTGGLAQPGPTTGGAAGGHLAGLANSFRHDDDMATSVWVDYLQLDNPAPVPP